MKRERSAAPDDARDVVKGTLDMLILKALDISPTHGWGVADRIETLSRGVFRLQTGTLYPALHRLLRNGWVAAEWRTSDNARRARYYKLTAKGLAQLKTETAAWKRMTEAIDRVLSFRESEGFA